MFHDWGTICQMTLWYGKQKSAQIVAVTAQGYSTLTMTHRLDCKIQAEFPCYDLGMFLQVVSLKTMCQWEGQ